MDFEDWTVESKTALITGGALGIGRCTAIEIAKKGLEKLYIADINVEQAEKVKEEIEAETKCQVVVCHLDLASLNSVRQLAKLINSCEPQLHLLINNAGINPPAKRKETCDGFELTFQTNFLGHFLLTQLLLGLLKRSAPSRIVAVASDGYKFAWPNGLRINDLQIEHRKFDFWDAYCQSKLAVVMTMRKLAKDLQGTGVSVFLLHPGMVQTTILKHRSKIWQNFVGKVVHPFRVIVISPEKGALTSIYCATHPSIEKYSGKYFFKCKPTGVWKMAKNKAKTEQLWKMSLKMCNL